MKIQYWKCKRCGDVFDNISYKCSCMTSPSPWEPIDAAEYEKIQERLKIDYTMSVPEDIREMAMKIENWFVMNNIPKWQLMGICSRNHANDLNEYKHIIAIVKSALDKL